MRRKSTLYVGMDVHRESIDIAVAEETGEVRHHGRIGGDANGLARAVRSSSPQGYDVKANGTTLEAFSIARDAKAAWEGYLRSKGLLQVFAKRTSGRAIWLSRLARRE
jgi:hypothetical protein